jgi:hypothetical protein
MTCTCRAALSWLVVCGLLPAAAPAVSAEDPLSGIQWNGFLNVVAGRDIREAGSDRPGFYGTSVLFDEDTLAGLQARKALDDTTSVTAQLVAKGADGYEANLRWLYLSHELTPDDLLRVGRIATPFYYYSDFQNVGYAYHWVEPPGEVYAFDTSLTGVAYLHRDSLGPFDGSVEVVLGGEKQFVPQVPPVGAEVDTRNARMLILTGTYDGWLTLRAMQFRATMSFSIDALTTANVIDLGLEGAVAAGQFDRNTAFNVVKPFITPIVTPTFDEVTALEERDVRYSEFAVRVDRLRWFGMAEWILFDTDQYLLGTPASWYLTGGYRLDRTTLYVSRARNDGRMSTDAREDARAVLPSNPTLVQQADFFASQTASTIAAGVSKNGATETVGVMQELSESVCGKIEVSRFSDFPSIPAETGGKGSNSIVRAGVFVVF